VISQLPTWTVLHSILIVDLPTLVPKVGNAVGLISTGSWSFGIKDDFRIFGRRNSWRRWR